MKTNFSIFGLELSLYPTFAASLLFLHWKTDCPFKCHSTLPERPGRPRRACVSAGVCSGGSCGCSSWDTGGRCEDGRCCGTANACSGQTSAADTCRSPGTSTASPLRDSKTRVRRRRERPEVTFTVLWLTGVDPAVLRQVAGHGEALPAVLADVRPLARVAPHVLLKVAAGRPTFAAHRAHVRPLPRVPAHVHVQASDGGEVFGAVWAAVGPLAAVRAQVALEAVAGLEALAALRTQVAGLGPVGQLVGLQDRQRGVGLVALVAAVSTRRVRALVNTKQCDACKQNNKLAKFFALGDPYIVNLCRKVVQID